MSALDVSIRAQIMNLLVDLQQQFQVSYLLIAHHLATTRYMAHEVAVMYLGKIVERAETEELYKNPLHPYTKALFSAALPSHPDIQREEIILSGEVPSPINPPPAAASIRAAPSPCRNALRLSRRRRRSPPITWWPVICIDGNLEQRRRLAIGGEESRFPRPGIPGSHRERQRPPCLARLQLLPVPQTPCR